MEENGCAVPDSLTHCSVAARNAIAQAALEENLQLVAGAEAPTKTPTKRIAIVAKAPSSKDAAPYGDPSWDIWSLGDSWRFVKRANLWFELHDLDEGFKRWPADFQQWLGAKQPFPILVQKPSAKCPHGQTYPWEEVYRLSPGGHGRYLTNSVSEMIAYALLLHKRGEIHLEELGLWGVDMACHGDSSKPSGAMGSSEYAHQRPSCEYWLGIAEGMGIKVTLAAESDLLRSQFVYALEENGNAAWRKLVAIKRKQEEAAAQIQQNMRQQELQLAQISGDLQRSNWFMQRLNGGGFGDD